MLKRFAKQVIRRIPHAGRRIGKSYRLIAELQDDSVYGSPIPCLDDIRRRADAIFDCTLRQIPGIDLRTTDQLKWLDEIAESYGEMDLPEQPADEHRFHFENGWYSYGDAVFLYGMLRRLQPSRVVEIGSGFSSFLMLDVNDRFLNKGVDFTFIDPNPQRLLSRLTDEDRKSTRIIEKPIQDVPESIVDELVAGDILFVDSSHVSRIGSDVNFILFGLLPRLAPGVHVHIHDIYYPFEYPRDMVLGGCFVNEAYLVRAFLQFNSDFEITIWNDFLSRFHGEQLESLLPLAARQPGASLWLQRTTNSLADVTSTAERKHCSE